MDLMDCKLILYLIRMKVYNLWDKTAAPGAEHLRGCGTLNRTNSRSAPGSVASSSTINNRIRYDGESADISHLGIDYFLLRKT